MKTYEALAKLLHLLFPGGGDTTLPALVAFAALPTALQKMKPAIQSALLHSSHPNCPDIGREKDKILGDRQQDTSAYSTS